MSYELHIGDIKKGDYFCEKGYGAGARFVAIEDGYLSEPDSDGDRYWKVRGRMLGTDSVTNFYVRREYLHYGPELYPGKEIPYIGISYPVGNDE